ncbi:MAG: class I SAM-dependent methyltransferase [Thiomicrospira sp.]|jgi:2-polyprenyl-3-methyl-5-hydroxy-6-metoxy-1,4-benzoquinol methylase|nr:class I SAM-dependent methyltransferase [Thiomicrospira sp.]
MWNEKYNRTDFLYGTQPNDFLQQACKNLPPNQTILCLAEGEGRNAVYLAECGHQVIAVDASQVGLDKAQALAKQRGVKIQTHCIDLAEFNFKQQTWDVVVSIFCHLPPTLRAQVHQQVEQQLNDGGLFILEAYAPKQLAYNSGGPKAESLLVELNAIKQEFSQLHWLHHCELERDIYEGTGHTGLGCVTQLIGQKQH